MTHSSHSDADDAPRIAVIGAGLAGLSAAYELASHGLTAQVYEANPDRLGGRCWSAREFADGQVGEHGGEFIDTRHVEIRSLAARLGLELDDLVAAAESAGSVDLDHFRGGFRSFDEVSAERRAIGDALRADAARVAYTPGSRPPQAAIDFDRLSVRDWVQANVDGGASSSAGTSLMNHVATLAGSEPHQTSAFSLLEGISDFVDEYLEDDESEESRASALADSRYRVRGGNDRLIARMHEELPPGTVHTGVALTALEAVSGGGYRLAFGSGRADVRADYVVLALPFPALRQVDLTRSGLSAFKREAIENLDMATNAKIILRFDRRPEAFDDWSGWLQSDHPRFSTWNSNPGKVGNSGLLTVFAGGAVGAGYATRTAHGAAPLPVVRDILNDLDNIVPGLRDAFSGDAWLDSWVDDPSTHGSYANFRPGDYTRYSGRINQREGNLLFAGEHVSPTKSRGYLNGAVETGLAAALALVTELAQRS